MKIRTPAGILEIDAEKKTKTAFNTIFKNLKKDFSILGAAAMEEEMKRHVQARYPGSNHWSPDKIGVTPDFKQVSVDIPGASRAFHPLDIYPVKAQALTIPLIKGTKAKDIQGMFTVGNLLSISDGSGMLIPMFVLSKHVHQKQDETLLPTFDRLSAVIENAVQEYIKTVPV